jgi:hypothetical protein
MDRKYRAKYYEELQNHFAEEGFTEELNEGNFVIPEEADYVDMEDDEEAEMFYFTEAPHCMDKTEGPDHYKMKAHDPGEMQDYVFVNKDMAIKKSQEIGMDGVVHEEKLGDGTTVYIPGPSDEMFNAWYRKHKMDHMKKMSEAPDHYESKADKHVKINKPFRTPDGPKKFSVYVKNEKGNVVKVNFGDPNMEIRRDDPDRRRNFRARHQCDTNPGPKWKARYWSCKMWSTPKVSDLTAKEHSKDVFTNPGEAMKRAKEMGLDDVHSHKDKDGNTVFMPGKTHEEYMKALKKKDEVIDSPEKDEDQGPSSADYHKGYKYQDPQTGEIYTFKRRGVYKKNGRVLIPVRASEEHTEALQYGKPPKNDPRKTPAPKKDRKRGSKKNKPDSAKKPNKSIKFSKEVTSQLSNMVKEHNAKGKGSKATLGALKAVYRRGAGAYSTSHAPKMSRHGWAIARVKAFLYLLRNGRPSNPNYKQDNDLLPKSHPRSSK